MSKKKTKTKSKPKPQAFVYVGGFEETKLWDGQTAIKGAPFTPKTALCAANCARSTHFEKA